jgi:hypothetical protein
MRRPSRFSAKYSLRRRSAASDPSVRIAGFPTPREYNHTGGSGQAPGQRGVPRRLWGARIWDGTFAFATAVS